MVWLDWVLLAILLLAAFFGLRHGVSSMLATVVILGVGIVVARPLAGVIEGWMGFVSEHRLVRMAAVYVVLVALAVIGASLLGSLFSRMLNFFPGGAILNRSIGAAIGLVVGLVLTSAVLSGIIHIGPGKWETFITGSAIGGFLTGPFHDAMAKVWLALPLTAG